jgi:hypothetical protein
MRAMLDYCKICGEKCYRDSFNGSLCGDCKQSIMESTRPPPEPLNERGRKRVENTAPKQGGSREQAE